MGLGGLKSLEFSRSHLFLPAAGNVSDTVAQEATWRYPSIE